MHQNDIAAAESRVVQHTLDDQVCSGRSAAIWLAPIVRVNLRAHDDVTHGLRNRQHLNFTGSFWLVVNSVRWAEQQRLHAEVALDEQFRQIQLDLQLRFRDGFEIWMRESVIAYFVALLVRTLYQLRMLIGGFADREKCCWSMFLFEDIEDFRRPRLVGTVVESQRHFVRRGTHLLDAPGKRITLIGFVVEHIARGIVIESAPATLRRRGDAPDVSRALQNQIVARWNFLEFCANRVGGMCGVPDGPDRRIFHAQAPQRGAAHAGALGGAQLVVRGDAIEHPDAVNLILLVRVGIVRVQRVGIEGHIRFRLDRSDNSLLKSKCLRDGVRNLFCFCRPVVAVVRDTHDDFVCRHNFHDVVYVAFEPVLRRDGSGVRGRIMEVVIHQDYGVSLRRQIFVVVAPVRGGQRDHQFQVSGVHGDREITDETREIRLAALWHQLKIHHDAGLVLHAGKIRERFRQMFARRGAREHFRHLFDHPGFPVVVIHHGHDRQLDRVGLHPRQQFGILFDVQPAIRRRCVQSFGDQQINIVVMQFQRSEAGGIVGHVKCRAQGIVILRQLA